MLYEVNENTGSLKSVNSSWQPRELYIEKYIITKEEGDTPILSEAVFGEPLLLVTNQVRTRSKKRADILALDRAGNGVVIELKRDTGLLGVETQALQYLADFSSYKGQDFIKKFCDKGELTEKTIRGFLGNNAKIEELNHNSRVILMARSFDSTLFSMGEWLSSKGVSFRCITYSPVEIENRRFLSFSVVFDRANGALFPISFASTVREPGYYWHNIASADQNWWSYLIQAKQIPACFENAPGDQGEKILTRYIPGDTIVAYAKGYGAVGWGKIPEAAKYHLVSLGAQEDRLDGNCRHRLRVNWEAVATNLAMGISPDIVREQFEIYHPVSTSVSIDPQKCNALIKAMSDKFK